MQNKWIQPESEIPDGDFFYQRHGEGAWYAVTRDELLNKLAGNNPPAFRTVAGITQSDENGKPTHLSGPFYADFDGDLGDCCDAFKKFLGKLQALGVTLDQCRLAATGGRGMHVEIPAACFMGKVPPGGVPDLHRVYREMAHSLFVETLDLRVYSVKRMWRTFHVQRPNGLFKVPLTVAEALSITADNYAELCSAPRPFQSLEPAVLCGALGLIYTKARDKASSPRNKAKATKGAALLQARCKAVGAPLPPSLLSLCSGVIPAREGVGFNLIALQLCTTAHAMNMDEDALVSLAGPLIQKHESDGIRYNSPRRREQELRRMFSYTEDAPYDLSIGGIRSILPKSARANDLRGL